MPRLEVHFGQKCKSTYFLRRYFFVYESSFLPAMIVAIIGAKHLLCTYIIRMKSTFCLSGECVFLCREIMYACVGRVLQMSIAQGSVCGNGLSGSRMRLSRMRAGGICLSGFPSLNTPGLAIWSWFSSICLSLPY